MGNWQLFIPELVVLAGAFAAFVLSTFSARERISWLCSIGFAAASVAATGVYLTATGEPFFPGIYRVDAFSQVLKLGIVVALLLTCLVSGHQGSAKSSARLDMPIFFAFSAVGMMMMVSATELLTLYVAMELSAYGLYIAAALHRSERIGSEAGVKYLLYGAAASAFTLYGISLIYGATGSTYITEIVAQPHSPLFIVGVAFAGAGLLFKLAVFPFHMWAPDTYQGAPHQAVTFIGTASKVAAVGVLARIVLFALDDPARTRTVLLVLCVASMTVGNLVALVQKDLKRLLAYSTIAHAGYILIGLVCLSQIGTAAAVFYTLVYVPIAFCVFVVVCTVGADGSNPKTTDLAGLYRRSPLAAATLAVGLFGLAGIPPTAGFIGKWFLFSAALSSKLFWLVLVAAINATISLYYYLIVMKEAYLTPSDAPPIRLPLTVQFASWLAIAMVTVAGMFPGPLWDLSAQAARALSAAGL